MPEQSVFCGPDGCFGFTLSFEQGHHLERLGSTEYGLARIYDFNFVSVNSTFETVLLLQEQFVT